MAEQKQMEMLSALMGEEGQDAAKMLLRMQRLQRLLGAPQDTALPPAPQEENYGYVRLVFAEGEQLDLCHGEYITECSPTAEILSGADEDFIFNGGRSITRASCITRPRWTA